MKRVSLLLTALLLLTACGGPEPAPSETAAVSDGYEDHFAYPSGENYQGVFAVDEKGVAYLSEWSIQDNKIITLFTAYDLDGNKTAEYNVETESNVTHLCAGGGKLFYASWIGWKEDVPYVWNREVLYRYDLETGENVKLDTPANLFSLPDAIKRLAYKDGKLYILAVHEAYLGTEYDIRQEDLPWLAGEDSSYTAGYEGRILAAYDIENDAIEIVFDAHILDFTPTPGGLLLLQAYDNIGGLYFAEFDPGTMTVGERVYRDIAKPAAFASDGYGILFSAGAGTGLVYPGGLYYWPLGEDTGVSELARSLYLHTGNNDGIAYYGGFTYYNHIRVGFQGGGDPEPTTLERVRNAAYIDLTPPIQIIGANLYGGIPRQGHNIQFAALSHDEFALAVLSGGVAYDIAYVNSRQDFAYNLRKQGSFYPLNDVPGVMEFLEDCHPFVREAATDTDGNVWMLPLSIEAAGILYHVENSQKAGLDFANAETVDDIISLVRKGAAYNPEGRDYVFNPAILSRNVLIRYLRDNDTLDTPEFRRLAPALKEFTRERIQWGRDMPFIILNEEGESIPNDGFLFDNQSVQTSAHIIGRDDLSIAPLTGTGAANPADAVFFCVNPDSRHLEKTLEYISHVCAYLSSQKDAGLLAAPAAYSDSAYARRRRELYAGSVIDFNLSDEVFADDFDRYLRDEISLDTLIREAGRKLAMYRGE